MHNMSFTDGKNLWAVRTSGVYSADCDSGRAHADEYVAALSGGHPAPMLNFIAQSQLARGQWGGMEIGFWQAIEDHLTCCTSS